MEVYIILCLLVTIAAQRKGDPCTIKGQAGICTDLEECPHATKLWEQNIQPQFCSYSKPSVVVCCPSKQSCFKYNPNGKLKYFSTEARPPIKGRFGVEEEEEDDFGYLIHGGYATDPHEFPHMVALGYGDRDDVQYLCGATLIDEYFALTAGHCIYSKQFKQVKWGRVGDDNLTNSDDDNFVQMLEVDAVYDYPDYRPPAHDHDIALIKFKNPALINPNVQLACLQSERDIPKELIATGWGQITFTQSGDGSLLKVNISQYPHENCSRFFEDSPKRELPKGITDDYMICAGGIDEAKDTCPGDSGGPIQVKKSNYTYVVGVTSFGKGCGVLNAPGVYTRVSHYYPWIETILSSNPDACCSTTDTCHRYNTSTSDQDVNPFAHVVALQYESRKGPLYRCAGTLIHKQFALSNADCLTNAQSAVKRVRLGGDNLNSTEDGEFIQMLDVEEIFVHPDYKMRVEHNIGLIKFKTPAILNRNVKPACIYLNYVLPERDLTAISLSMHRKAPEERGKYVKVNVTQSSHQRCARLYKDKVTILPNGIVAETMICAKTNEERDTCQGDGGSPLQLNGENGEAYVVGLTSFGVGCANERYPAVYVRLSYYYPWIKSIVWPDA